MLLSFLLQLLCSYTILSHNMVRRTSWSILVFVHLWDLCQYVFHIFAWRYSINRILLSNYDLIFFPFLLCCLWQVMSVKALGIALKLTFSGMNQLIYPQTWLFTIVVVACIVTQMNYLNKVIVIFIFDEIVQLCITSSIQYSLVVTFATCFLCFTWKWHLVIRMSMLLECSTWV